MIIGTVTPDGVFIEAEVQVANQSTPTPIRFLADSGADITAIHPWDLAQMRLPAPVLNTAPVVHIIGIGGPAAYRILHATITIPGAYADGTPAYWTYPVILHIAVPTEYNETFPSILGRDILYHWLPMHTGEPDTIIFVPKEAPHPPS